MVSLFLLVFFWFFVFAVFFFFPFSFRYLHISLFFVVVCSGFFNDFLMSLRWHSRFRFRSFCAQYSFRSNSSIFILLYVFLRVFDISFSLSFVLPAFLLVLSSSSFPVSSSRFLIYLYFPSLCVYRALDVYCFTFSLFFRSSPRDLGFIYSPFFDIDSVSSSLLFCSCYILCSSCVFSRSFNVSLSFFLNVLICFFFYLPLCFGGQTPFLSFFYVTIPVPVLIPHPLFSFLFSFSFSPSDILFLFFASVHLFSNWCFLYFFSILTFLRLSVCRYRSRCLYLPLYFTLFFFKCIFTFTLDPVFSVFSFSLSLSLYPYFF